MSFPISCNCVAKPCCCQKLLANQWELEKSASWLRPYDTDGSAFLYFSKKSEMTSPMPPPLAPLVSFPIVQDIVNIKEEEEEEEEGALVSAADIDNIIRFNDAFIGGVNMNMNIYPDLDIDMPLDSAPQDDTTMPSLTPSSSFTYSSVKNEIVDEELPPPPLERPSPSPDTLVYPLCEKPFTYQGRHQTDVKFCVERRNNAGQQTCLNCNITFQTEVHLQEHRLKHHEIEMPFVCNWDKCGRKFRKAHHLRHHQNVHFKSDDYRCQACDKAFGSLCSVKTHEKKATICRKKIMLTKKN